MSPQTSTNSLENLRNFDMSHRQLGIAADFAPAEDQKNALCDFLIGLCADLLKANQWINPILYDEWGRQIFAVVEQIARIRDEIQKIAQQTNSSDFPNNRKAQVDNIVGLNLRTRIAFLPCRQSLDLLTLQAQLGSVPLSEMQNKASESLAAITATQGQVDQILLNLRTSANQKLLADSTAAFSNLATNHSAAAGKWFVACAVVMAGLLVFAVVFAFEFFGFTKAPDSWGPIASKIILLAAFTLLFRVCLSKYNAEANLTIIYQHRVAVLQQYRDFENSIAQDNEAKNHLRLEIAKYIFTDPRTGYLSEPSGSELSFSPAVQVMDRLAPKP
ncbi:MAG: hypothetical protein JNM27_08650 [Leptospirales bacterium]|nr:hypothetical protein [Leptospirales bacterium]